MMKQKVNGGTLFSGGEGAGIGMMLAGVKHKWGVEFDPKIARVGAQNTFGQVFQGDVTKVLPYVYSKVDMLHPSPPCPNFSVGKLGGEETFKDIRMAEHTMDWFAVHRPIVWTLENVRAYEKSESWKAIREGAQELGYIVQWAIINTADYGVPQKRERMFAVGLLTDSSPYSIYRFNKTFNGHSITQKDAVDWIENEDVLFDENDTPYTTASVLRECGLVWDNVTIEQPEWYHDICHKWKQMGYLNQTERTTISEGKTKGGRFMPPPATHCRNGYKDLFGSIPKWNNWWDAIEDLVGDLEQGDLADWQFRRLMADGQLEDVAEMILNEQNNRAFYQANDKPITTATATGSGKQRLVMSKNNSSFVVKDTSPSLTITGSTKGDSYLIQCNNPNSNGYKVLDNDRPSRTVDTTSSYKLIISGQSSGEFGGFKTEDGVPMNTVVSSTHKGPGKIINQETTPIPNLILAKIFKKGADGNAIYSEEERDYRLAFHSLYTVYRLNPYCYARWQTFPNWYKYPTKTKRKTGEVSIHSTLAYKIIGNAVPTLFMKKLTEHILNLMEK